MAQMGTLVTDFNLIKPGVLHRANGGYLLVDARKILSAYVLGSAQAGLEKRSYQDRVASGLHVHGQHHFS